MLTGEMLDDGQYDFELKLIKDENSPTVFVSFSEEGLSIYSDRRKEMGMTFKMKAIPIIIILNYKDKNSFFLSVSTAIPARDINARMLSPSTFVSSPVYILVSVAFETTNLTVTSVELDISCCLSSGAVYPFGTLVT